LKKKEQKFAEHVDNGQLCSVDAREALGKTLDFARGSLEARSEIARFCSSLLDGLARLLLDFCSIFLRSSMPPERVSRAFFERLPSVAKVPSVAPSLVDAN
jgi:predicted nuclease of restriction endonuclease-like RecB superfamily